MKLIDKEIAEQIAGENGLTVAKLGLRFDKVVVRLLSNTRNAVSDHIPAGTTVLITLAAPVKLPAKTELELCRQIREYLLAEVRHQDNKSVFYGNTVCVRLIDVPGKQPVRLLGFVHNPGTDPVQLLNMANRWLVKNN